MRFKGWLVAEMAMRGAGDLPPGTYIWINVEHNKVTIRYSDEDGGEPEGPPRGAIVIARDPAVDVWRVADVHATGGWGPLLYDLAMEYASRRGTGLAPDYHHGSSAAAQAVWSRYRDRPDVVARETPETGVYYLKDFVTLPALRAAGKVLE